MRNISKTQRLVAEILEANGFEFENAEGALQLRFASSRVQVIVDQLGAQTIVELRARVLREIPNVEEQAPAILRELNELNIQSRFCKWLLDESEREIDLEYDLLGDQLQQEELISALTLMARLADREDDALQKEFGGVRAFE